MFPNFVLCVLLYRGSEFYSVSYENASEPVTGSSEEIPWVIWATDDIWFVNSSTWLDFDFWTWSFEIYIDIFMFKFTIVA